ncbi:MAG: hypothetical protein JO035_13975 [Betaproteobacteria bacterium]|nr:hypothetical protein [Betaproteobacteria bacterium]
MPPWANYVWSELVSPALNAFALLASLVGLVIAAGLLGPTQATLAAMRRVNRRISLRQATKPLEVPVIIDGPSGARRHPALGVAFMLGGAYAAAVLLLSFDPAAGVAAFRISSNPVTAQVIFESMRWFLIVGGLAGVAVGAMMIFFPAAWQAVEARANRWYSTRQLMRGGDEMHEGLDRWVEAFPRRAGFILGATSLVAAAAFAILLFY